MGCCCGVTYEEEVETEINNYLKTINQPDDKKRQLLKEIKEDLSRRASTVNKYYYPYRIEDVEKTVNYYKSFIKMRFKGFFDFYDVKKNLTINKEKEQLNKQEQEKNNIKLNQSDESEIEKEEDKIKDIIVKKKEPTKLNNNNINSGENKDGNNDGKIEENKNEENNDKKDEQKEENNKKEDELNNNKNEVKEGENNNKKQEEI